MGLRAITSTQRDNCLWLVSTLRHLPADFVWNYGTGQCCAMELARRLGLVEVPYHMISASPFQMTPDEAGAIFCDAGGILGKLNHTVTADDVADLLQGWLDQQPVVVPVGASWLDLDLLPIGGVG